MKKNPKHPDLTSDKEIPVKFACDPTADVICMFLVRGDCRWIWDVPNSTGVIIWRCHDLVMIWSKICEVDSPTVKKKN